MSGMVYGCPVNTFSIGFTEGDFEELYYAHASSCISSWSANYGCGSTWKEDTEYLEERRRRENIVLNRKTLASAGAEKKRTKGCQAPKLVR